MVSYDLRNVTNKWIEAAPVDISVYISMPRIEPNAVKPDGTDPPWILSRTCDVATTTTLAGTKQKDMSCVLKSSTLLVCAATGVPVVRSIAFVKHVAMIQDTTRGRDQTRKNGSRHDIHTVVNIGCAITRQGKVMSLGARTYSVLALSKTLLHHIPQRFALLVQFH